MVCPSDDILGENPILLFNCVSTGKSSFFVVRAMYSFLHGENAMSESSLIPASGKSSDLDIEKILTVSDADRVLLWLHDILKDMALQVSDRGVTDDQAWLKRLRAAERNTIYLRHRVLEIRDRLNANPTIGSAIIAALFRMGDDDLIDRLEAQIHKDNPSLKGFSLLALKGSA